VDTGPGNRFDGGTAHMAGAQLAWWQLGFRTRSAVLTTARRGEPYPDAEVWRIASTWAAQTLSAPWWWRLARAGLALVVAIPILAAIVVAVDRPDWLAAGVAGPTAVAAAVMWVWINNRHARRIAALTPGGRPAAGIRVTVVRVVALVAALVLVPAGYARAVWQDRSSHVDCPPVVIDDTVRRWWLGQGGRIGTGCPVAATAVGPDGQRSTPFYDPGPQQSYVVYELPRLGLMVVPADISAAWMAAGGATGTLGYPVDFVRGDGPLTYLNFQYGSIVREEGGAAVARPGAPYLPGGGPGPSCDRTDRPCVVTLRYARGVITLGWWYADADAFTVSWWRGGDPDSHIVTVAGREFTLSVPAGYRYGFAVQACDKHFLRPSTCTSWSRDAVVTTG
jgi:hypothetical protein